MLNADELERVRQDALLLVEIRKRNLRKLEDRGASYEHIRQARQDLDEAKKIARHANKLVGFKFLKGEN